MVMAGVPGPSRRLVPCWPAVTTAVGAASRRATAVSTRISVRSVRYSELELKRWMANRQVRKP